MGFFRKSPKMGKKEKMTTQSLNQQNDQVHSDLFINEEKLRTEFANCADVEYRTISLNNQLNILFVYIDGLCDTKILEESVLKPLIFQGIDSLSASRDLIKQQLIPIAKVKTGTKIS